MQETAYMTERIGERWAFFAASNSAQGFYSRYAMLFEHPTARLYLIKGGPGSGKSRLLWEIVTAAEGAGFTAELYPCSSDPTSLDAVHLEHPDGRCLIALDATAPHSMEANRPGVREQLIDLGAFWDQEQLLSQRAEIEQLMEQKEGHYEAAYRYLGAAELCRKNAAQILAPLIRTDALRRLARRCVAGAIEGERKSEAAVKHVCTDSIGMKGRIYLPTLVRHATRLCCFPPCYGLPYLMLEEIRKEGEQRGADMIVSHHPAYPDCVDGVFFRESRVACLAHPVQLDGIQGYCRSFRLRHLLDAAGLREVREQLRMLQKQQDTLESAAVQALDRASRAHFALEEIYGAAMDFSAKEEYSRRLIAKLFGKE
ncbi:MAG: hypothetical protein IJY66_05310 [Clostridia bacterium]|nr:hypothetical protein [Clostridia bacterium]